MIQVPDHLGMVAPFPALVTAAAVTERPRLGTTVLNAGFWNPTLLAREVATADALTGDRLEVGPGTGHVQAEPTGRGCRSALRGSAWTICSARSRNWTRCPAVANSPMRNGCRC